MTLLKHFCIKEMWLNSIFDLDKDFFQQLESLNSDRNQYFS